MARKRDPWCCPRCGLEGNRLKSRDPNRCKACCRLDAADEMYAAIEALLDATVTVTRKKGTITIKAREDAHPAGVGEAALAALDALARARGETP